MMENRRLRLRPFLARVPSGDRYWTVLDEDELVPVAEVDEFLRHVRFGRDQADAFRTCVRRDIPSGKAKQRGRNASPVAVNNTRVPCI
ncbi:hypothetical protein [Streptomyces sp. NPDC050422]|uniref:hypothetical protein n=1 Tax=Streptomyces sp. NPDC050422 TaxID=3365614 RepID=UPI0037BAFD3E